jgi:hypothetical protein
MTTATLYDLTGRAASLSNRIEVIAADLSDPEADVTAIHAKLEELITAEANNRDALNAKADAWCWVITNMRDRAQARKIKAKQLQELAKADELQADALLDRLVGALSRIDPTSTRFDFGVNALCSRASTKVKIEDDIEPEDLPEEYQRIVTEISFNKEAMLRQLKAGKTIKGVELVKGRTWRIA